MSRQIVVALAAASALVQLAVARPASATFIVGRNPQHPTLQVDSSGHALITFTSGGQTQHILVWGAVNAIPPTRGKQQAAFKVDFSGGSAIKQPGYWRTFKNVCKPYTGPVLAWYVPGSGCTAPDGSYWALQLWQRMLPDLGFKPWRPEQSVYELHVSHWTGPLAAITVYTDWAWGGRFQQIFGQLTYDGKPVYGFGATTVGNPTDSYGRNLYLDTFDSPYGAGWRRENSFLAQLDRGAFCYSFGSRPPYPGYPKSPPRAGPGKLYRITVLGPGVTPAVMWQGPSPGNWNASDAAKQALEEKAAGLKRTLHLSSTECHS
jgi:hypothetical protein